MKKYHFVLILLIVLMCAPAKATILFISLDSSTLTGSVGDVLHFSGTIQNQTGATVFLNGDNFTLPGFDPSAFDDGPFFANAPLSLDAGVTTADIGLFNVTIPSPHATGNFPGTFQILGGADSNAQGVVGTVDFTVQVQAQGVPEPSSSALLSSALLLLLVAKRIIPRPAR
jgi:hypothetical protein